MLIEQPIQLEASNIPSDVLRFADEGLAIANKIDCFHFIPSVASHVWQVLATLDKVRFCEWGSGIGIATGMAAMLGHAATGIEINEELALASRKFLQSHDLDCEIHHGSYFDIHVEADYYFVYCWPGQQNEVERHFFESTPPEAKLLICHGAEDVRLKIKSA